MIRIAIVEDDRNYQEQITQYLLRYQEEFSIEVEVSIFDDGKKILENYRPFYDIILMDIEMPDTDGMTAAKKIRTIDSEVIIIFITNMAKYAIKGYEVNALDFVLKPINYFLFTLKMDNAIKMIKRREGKSILLFLDNMMKKVTTSDIYYIEVMKHDLYYHTIDGVIKQQGSLKDVEKILTGEPFKRCNNCYLVNLKFVSGIVQNTVVVAGESLQMSRPKKKEFMQAVADYIGGIG
ncbi:MAG: response regulator of the LytR/AlgR family [Herbinix sp.]|jgi:DNA-binding LytR/AlgR family response regulator|nr:response regulator of the LytR/AlgR family [Herbinix sp.]